MPAAAQRLTTEVLVVGSGAGGAVVAATLAEAGFAVLVAEEGPAVDPAIATHSPAAMRTLYRRGGLTPILGPARIALVEGCCVGGSTEINSAFWHRTPAAALNRWHAYYAVCDLSLRDLLVLFDELERELGIAVPAGEPPPSSALFRLGAERLGWQTEAVPTALTERAAVNQFAPGAKRSMSRSYLPRAAAAGARLLAATRIDRLERRGARVVRALGHRHGHGGDAPGPVAIEAEHVFVCGGAIQTPRLLRRSGIRRNVGDNLHIHPMLKVAAEFDQPLDGHLSPLPYYQVQEFAPEITLGGSVFTPGFLALTLADNWERHQWRLRDWRHMALYYTACKGSTRGSVRLWPFGGEPLVRYRLSRADQVNLSVGMARLGELLFAAGARRLYPGLAAPAVLRSATECQAFLREPIAPAAMSLSTVHMFGTCPMGEDRRVCATGSHGQVHGLDNLWVADASVIPDALGVNPQGTVMALALRSARRFVAEHR